MIFDFLPKYTEINKVYTKHHDTLIIVPVYNEIPHLRDVIHSIRENWSGDILAVEDCSTDDSLAVLKEIKGISIITNERNAGAGGVLLQGFKWAYSNDYKNIITMDADGQHNPESISCFFKAIDKCGCCCSCDFVWGSRYLNMSKVPGQEYQDRREINFEITHRLNEITGYKLTDAFCGFRAYRVESLAKLPITETGYGMFMQMTVLAAKNKLSIREIEVPLLYLDETRNFNGNFSDSDERLQYYHDIIDSTLAQV